MDTKLTPKDIERYRLRLLDDLAGRARGVETVQAEALEPSGTTRFQDVDDSIEEAALEVELTTLAAQDRQGYEIHDALQRIAEGTYGRCEDCGAAIPRARLELLAHARRCAACENRRSPEEARP